MFPARRAGVKRKTLNGLCDDRSDPLRCRVMRRTVLWVGCRDMADLHLDPVRIRKEHGVVVVAVS